MVPESTRLREALVEWGVLVRSRWSTALLIASAVLLAGASLRGWWPELYEASARLSIGTEADPAQLSPAGFRESGANEMIRAKDEIESFSFLSEVSASRSLPLRWKTTGEESLRRLLRERVRIEPIFNEHALVIRCRDVDPAEAATLANEVAARFLARRRASAQAEANARVRRLEARTSDQTLELERIEDQIREAPQPDREALRLALVSGGNLLHSLEAKLQLARIEATSVESSAQLVSPASPDRADHVFSFWKGAGGLLFLSIGTGLLTLASSAWLRKRQSRAGTVASMVKHHQLHFAGLAPVSGRSAVSEEALAPEIFEPYREMRNRILKLPCGECCFLAILPLREFNASPETVANLACVLADSGRTTLVIDADCRAPRLHPYFDAAQHPGLTDFLRGEMRLEETVLRTRRPNLWFMPSGPISDDPGGLFNGRRMTDLVRDLRSRFEIILLASPALGSGSEAGLLAGLSDFTVLVSPFAAHSDRRLREARVALENSEASLAGLMLATTTPLRRRDQTGRPEPAPLGSRNSSK